MIIDAALFRTLVRTLSPLLLERGRRNYYLTMAFPGQSRYYQVSPDIQDAPLYAQQILAFLSGSDRLPGGEGALRRYVETAWWEAEQDATIDLAATLAALVAQLRGYERLRERLLAEGLDPTKATMEDAIRLSLDDLLRREAEGLRRYVDLAGERSRRAASSPAADAWSTDPLAALGISLVGLEGSQGRGQEVGEPVASVRQALLGVRRGVLLGEPGSEKTFTLTRVALDSAARGGRRIGRGEGAMVRRAAAMQAPPAEPAAAPAIVNTRNPLHVYGVLAIRISHRDDCALLNSPAAELLPGSPADAIAAGFTACGSCLPPTSGAIVASPSQVVAQPANSGQVPITPSVTG